MLVRVEIEEHLHTVTKANLVRTEEITFFSPFEPSPMEEGLVDKANKQHVKWHNVNELTVPKRPQVHTFIRSRSC